MKIIKIEPQGFCGGVVYAINMVEKALAGENATKPIYMLGNVVHNKTLSAPFAKEASSSWKGRLVTKCLRKSIRGRL